MTNVKVRTVGKGTTRNVKTAVGTQKPKNAITTNNSKIIVESINESSAHTI